MGQGWSRGRGLTPTPSSCPTPEESDYLTEYEDEGPEPARGEEDAFAATEGVGASTLEVVSAPGH